MIKSQAVFSLAPLIASMRKIGLTGLLMASLAGCGGTLSGAGPYKDDIEDKNPAYDLVEISAATLAPFIRPAAKVPVAKTTPPVSQPVRLMGGDVLNILITDNVAGGAGLFAPLSSGGTQFKVRIDDQGMISLPYVGHQFVAGMTLIEVEDLIKKQLKGVTTDVQTHVDLIGDLSGSVLVAGAVKAPGRFSTLQSPLTLLDAINQAGGPVLEPHLVNVIVRNGSQASTLNYEDILNGQNVVLRPNSEIVLERARQRFVAMGAVGEPGLHDLPQQNTTLLDALGAVGGLSERNANPQGVFLFRMDDQNPVAKPIVMRLNMRDPAAIFYAKQIVIKPDDTIYVTNAAVYEWQKIITPIVQTMVLGRAVGVN